MQRSAFSVLVDVRREDDDWQVNLASVGTQGFQNSEAIKMWHEQIEQNQVRIELVAKFQHPAGISCLLKVGVAWFPKHVFQESDVSTLVVNDSDLDFRV